MLAAEPGPRDPVFGNRRRGIPVDTNQPAPEQPPHCGLDRAFRNTRGIRNYLMAEAPAPFAPARHEQDLRDQAVFKDVEGNTFALSSK
jgi:hypothetical protein